MPTGAAIGTAWRGPWRGHSTGTWALGRAVAQTAEQRVVLALEALHALVDVVAVRGGSVVGAAGRGAGGGLGTNGDAGEGAGGNNGGAPMRLKGQFQWRRRECMAFVGLNDFSGGLVVDIHC